jgi:L-ascorbate metabolism protein UlaG (beta-lactamase superfamily)
MKITFINHASFAVEHDGINLVIDPWLEGMVFNNGWNFISETRFRYDDFKNVTHIWFSHEHPDHFFPPNISKIPADFKKNITVLFQETTDKRVVTYCRKQGFKEVIELKPDKFQVLSDDFSVLCEHYQEGDSWIYIKTNDVKILNTNDCGIRDRVEAEKIKSKIGDKPDYLFTQFSYAYWAGNRDQQNYRRKIADEKLQGLKFQVDVFKPRITVPIASFVWFCHEENYYLNDEVNRPQKVVDFILKNTDSDVVLLYPGEVYEPGTPHDNRQSIEKYNVDFEKISRQENLVRVVPVAEEELIQHAGKFVNEMKRKFGFWTSLLKPCHVYITDYGKSLTLSMKHGLSSASLSEDDCDCSLSSESLAYNFKFPWGNDSLGINGRYQRPVGGNYSRFYNFFRYNQLESRGIQINLGFFTDMALRKILVRAGLKKI